MYMKRFTLGPKCYTKDNTGHDGELFGIASVVVSIQTLVVRGLLAKTDCFSKTT